MKGERKIMKKTLYFLVFLSLIITTLFLPKYSQLVFVLKHTLIFIFGASLIIVFIKKLYNILLVKYEKIITDKKLVLFRLFTLVVISGLLFLGRTIQLNYIALYESPPVVLCYYYDEYGNYIHGSRMTYVCPTLEIIEKNENYLKFRAEYDYPGNRDDYLRSDNSSGPYYRGYDGYGVVDVEIEYNDEHFITSYTSQTSINYELLVFSNTDSLQDSNLSDEGEILKYYNSFQLSIQTEYDHDSARQIKSFYVIEQNNIQYNDIKNVSHYDFSNSEPVSTYQLDLDVTNSTETHKEFEIYDLARDNLLAYLGYIDIENDTTKVFFEMNPDNVAIEPNEISDTYIIKENIISRTHISGSSRREYEYELFNTSLNYIQTKYSYSKQYQSSEYRKSKGYEIDNTIIVEGVFETYKMFKTSYGFMIEEYQGDNHVEEIPHSNDDYLTSPYRGLDELVFSTNPIRLIYEYQPICNINPMIRYLYEKHTGD